MSGPSGPGVPAPVVSGDQIIDDFITIVFGKIDDLGTRVVSSYYHELATALTPIFAVLATLYIAFFGLQMIYGETPVSLPMLYKRLGGLVFIYFLTISWALFEPMIAKPLMQTPDAMAALVCKVTSPGECGAGSNTATSLMNILRAGYGASMQVSEAGGWTGVGLMILGIVILIFVGLFIVAGVGMIILSKIGIMLMLALAPLFLICWLFQLTRPLFTGWITVVSSFFVFQIIVFGMLGFTFFLVKTFVADVRNAGVEVGLREVVPFIIMLVVSFTLLKAAMTIAIGIAGGARMDGSSGLANASRRGLGASKSFINGVWDTVGPHRPPANASIGPDPQRASIQAAAREARR